tara:strand:+ start:724 stop:867 length:144 start_codon:yes stop_codon:yes gene_type:complete
MALPSKQQLSWTLDGIELIQRAQELLKDNDSEDAKKWKNKSEEWLAS